jgi:hypothetical protein
MPSKPRYGRIYMVAATSAAIQRAGFVVSVLEEFLFPAARTPISFHIVGHATAPGG